MKAVFSALAVVTNIPQLHAKLFGTHPPLQQRQQHEHAADDGGVSPDVEEASEDNRSLIDILTELWVEAEGRMASVEDADEKLQWMRQSLGVAAAGSGGVRVGADLGCQGEHHHGSDIILYFCLSCLSMCRRRLDSGHRLVLLFFVLLCHREALMQIIKVWPTNSKRAPENSDFCRRSSCWRSLSKNSLRSYR